MKTCPQCRRTYTDESLNYCLDDGEELIYGPGEDERPTAVFPSGEQAAILQSLSPESVKRQYKKLGIAASICLLILAVAAVAAYWYYSGTSRKQINSIAVLPFQNLSGNVDAEYLSDGIAESLINNLSDLQLLKVTARSTAFRYKGRELDPIAIGRELDAKALLTGTVRQVGDRLDVQVDLIDTSDGAQLWGKEYERSLSDVLSVKQSIAREVVDRLKLRLTGDQQRLLVQRDTTNPEAYQLYLKGRYFWGRRSPDTIKKAIEYFEQSIENDPGFALAYAGLADAYVVPATRIPPNEAMPKAKAAAMRALEIDNTLAEAHTSLGRVLQVYDWNWKEAQKEFKRAIELNPRYPLAHQWYGGYLERTGHIEGGITERKAALELDPLSAITTFELGQAYFFARDYDRALEHFQKALELEPNFPAAQQYIPAVYLQKGMYDAAIAKFNEAPESSGIFATGITAYGFALAGRTREAQTMLEQLKQLRGREYVSAVAIAMVYHALGDKNEAFEWLEKGFQERAFQMQTLQIDPRWDGIRDDPRFVDLTKRMGLPQ